MNDSNPRKKLSDILNGNADTLRSAWQSTEAAGDFAPLPAGDYACRILSGELRKARTGTPEYLITFEVTDGEQASRRIWHSLYLTAAALPMSKRDLAKLGVTSLEQLERPIPQGILATLRLSIRRGDDGIERNKVVKFDVTGTEPPDPFAPPEDSEAAVPKPDPAPKNNGGASASPTMFTGEATSTPKVAMAEGK